MADSELQGVWRDGPYLIVRHRVAQFPQRCIICGDKHDCRPLACKVRRRPGLLQFFLWWTGVFSNAVVIRPYLCTYHRKQELKWRWFGHFIILIAIAMIVVPFAWLATARHVPNSVALLIPLGAMLMSLWVYYRIFRHRAVYAEHIKMRDAWVQDIPQPILDRIPVLPGSQC